MVEVSWEEKSLELVGNKMGDSGDWNGHGLAPKLVDLDTVSLRESEFTEFLVRDLVS